MFASRVDLQPFSYMHQGVSSGHIDLDQAPVEDHPPAVLQVTVLQVVQAEGVQKVWMGTGLSLPDSDQAWAQMAKVEQWVH